MDDIHVCSELADEIFTKAASKIQDNLLKEMVPHFVKKQMMNGMREVTIHGKYKPDHARVNLD